MIDFYSLGPGHQFFSWHREGSDRIIHFAITLLREHLIAAHFTETTILITDHLIEAAHRNGIEPVHLRQMTKNDVGGTLILLSQSDGTHIIVDGNHTLVKRHEFGMKTAQAWLVPEAIWARYEIKNLPDQRGALLPGFVNKRG